MRIKMMILAMIMAFGISAQSVEQVAGEQALEAVTVENVASTDTIVSVETKYGNFGIPVPREEFENAPTETIASLISVIENAVELGEKISAKKNKKVGDWFLLAPMIIPLLVKLFRQAKGLSELFKEDKTRSILTGVSVGVSVIYEFFVNGYSDMFFIHIAAMSLFAYFASWFVYEKLFKRFLGKTPKAVTAST